MENGPFEDDFPIENDDIPASYVSLPKGTTWKGSMAIATPISLGCSWPRILNPPNLGVEPSIFTTVDSTSQLDMGFWSCPTFDGMFFLMGF